MGIFKCKMCGGNLEVTEGSSVGMCEYCGTKQTFPTSKDENLQGLYNRANTLRIKSEFDKAEQLYEKILQVDNTQAEAYWGLILCKYGIEYVEDLATFKRIPTCHRASYDSIIADDDYKSALKYADDSQRNIYEQEAKAIDEIQKNILNIVKNEEPFDVFICYKETDENGKRTIDSVISNDIYYQLTQEGYKVFYAPITLEDKLGQEYEPYIFAALNSAKVMLVVGTKLEFFNAVWVKNEWSRYLKLLKTDRSKMIIPCYRDMDAYDLPDEFAHLQSQDMSKIGFINDVSRGIKKVVRKEILQPTSTSPKKETISQFNSLEINKKREINSFNILEKILLVFSCVWYPIYFYLSYWNYGHSGENKLLGIGLCFTCVVLTFFSAFAKKGCVLLMTATISFLISVILMQVFNIEPYYYYVHMMSRAQLGQIACAILALGFILIRNSDKWNDFIKNIRYVGVFLLIIGCFVTVGFIYEWSQDFEYMYEWCGNPIYYLLYLLSGLAPSILSIFATMRNNKKHKAHI